MKLTKKIFSILFLFVFALSLVACAKDNDDKPAKKDPNPIDVSVDVDLDSKWSGNLTGKKVYLTTCGQADSGIISSVLNNGGVSDDAYVSEDLLTVTKIGEETSNFSEPTAVILVVGASSKGLGDAGVDVKSETARAKEFADAADEGKFELIVVHVGGTARRGETSDPIIKAATPSANLLLVVEAGNNDNYFTNTASEKSIEIYLYSKNSKMINTFKTLFAIE